MRGASKSRLMKKKCTLYLIVVIISVILPSLGGVGGGFLYAQNFLWGRSGGSTDISSWSLDRESVYDVATDRNGNVYLIAPVKKNGLQISGQPLTGYGESDIMLASYKPDGTLRWVKMIGGNRSDYCTWLATDDKDGVYLSGSVQKYDGPAYINTDAISPKNNQTYILVKYDTAGKFQWYRHPEPDTLTTSGNSISYAMDVDKSGNVYWLMNLAPGGYGGGALSVTTQSTYIFKYSTSGGFSYLKPDIEVSGVPGIAMTIDESNDRFYISGTLQANSSVTIGGQTLTGGMYIGCYKLDGSLLWKKENTTGSFGGFSYRPVVDGAGNIYLAGGAGKNTTFNGIPLTQSKEAPLVMKMDKDGNHIWVKTANINASTGAIAVALLNNNQVILAGEFPGLLEWPGSGIPGFNSPQNYYYDMFITRFDAGNGTVLGMDRTSSSFGYYEFVRCMAADGNGHVYIGGEFDGDMFVNQSDTIRSSGGDMDWFVVKYGDMWPASVEANTTTSAVKIYPNPATDRLIIEGAKAGTELFICNMIGQQVYHSSTYNGNKVIDVSGLPAGNYVLQLMDKSGSRINRKIVKE